MEKPRNTHCTACRSKKNGNWISCCVCRRWFHTDCVGVSYPDCKLIDWICSNCKTNLRGLSESTAQDIGLNWYEDYQRLKRNEERNESKSIGSPNKNDNSAPSHSGTHREFSGAEKKPEIEAKPEVQSTSKGILEWTKYLKLENFINHEPQVHLSETTAPNIDKKKFDETSESEADTEEYRSVRSGRGERSENRNQAEMESSSDLNNMFVQLTKMMIRQNMEPLPDFSGEHEKFAVFYAQYKSTKTQLSNEENMRRLRNSIKGDAYDIVKAKLAFSRDPDEVITALREVYGRTDNVVRRIVNKLRAMRTPDETSPLSLRRFKSVIEEACATLLSLEAHTYLKSPTLVDDILRILPVAMKRSWGHFASNTLKKVPGEAVLIDVVKWLESYTSWVYWDPTDLKKHDGKSNSASSRVNIHNTLEVDEHYESASTTEAASTSASVTAKAGNSSDTKQTPKQTKPDCLFCSRGNHDISVCSQFLKLNVNKRWEYLKKKHICYVCLRKMHKSTCPDKKECGTEGCKKFHHKVLHKNTPPEPIEDPKTEEKAPPKKPDSHFVSTDQQDAVHFKIVPVKLFGKDPEGRETVVECNAFMDDGSALSMISNQLVDALNLKGPVEELCLEQ